MIRTLIIDDEKNNAELILNLLGLYCPSIEIVAQANSVQSGYKAILEHKPELVFLDVQMADGNGFDLMKLFSSIQFKVIFVTAHQEFAIDAFKFSAIDYLLKPLSPATLIAAVNKAELAITKDELNLKMQTLLSNLNEAPKAKRKIVLKTLERIYSLELSEIIRFESEGNYTKAYLKDGKKIMVSKLIKEFDEMLMNQGFVRVHQSHLVNSAYFYFYEKSQNNLVLKDNSNIPVSARKKEHVLNLINQL